MMGMTRLGSGRGGPPRMASSQTSCRVRHRRFRCVVEPCCEVANREPLRFSWVLGNVPGYVGVASVYRPSETARTKRSASPERSSPTRMPCTRMYPAPSPAKQSQRRS